MSEENMVMSLEEIQHAILNPDFITHLHGLHISNRWGDVNGRQFLLNVYKLCERQQELLQELKDIKKG